MKFMFLFVRLHEPDIQTQQTLGGEWLASSAEGIVDSCAPFEEDAKLVRKTLLGTSFREKLTTEVI